MSAAVIVLACVLMCPLSMGLMMLFMRRGRGHASSGSADQLREHQDADG